MPVILILNEAWIKKWLLNKFVYKIAGKKHNKIKIINRLN